ncbi:DNA-directed RNA polymerase III, subunit 14 [Enterocytozoon bieneusi H348]|nr:DNA-directed RNA polymerase III, subunit 14 [Enterocytozoon bieneusi H348]|eukprot:XP_002650018.1 DNA-directed RNA polymerase III, subunit 14 [Enterocytozoon bieneusi H348]
MDVKEIFDFIETRPNGVTEDDLLVKFSKYNIDTVKFLLQELIESQKLELKQKNGKVIYVVKFIDQSNYENLILSLLEKSGPKGLWIKDIRIKANIPYNFLVKILKKLEQEQLIKSVKGINTNKKTYILYDIEPDKEVTGGIWFTNNDVDLSFVNNLMEIIYQYILKHQALNNNKTDIICLSDLATIDTIYNFIITSNILEVKISKNEVKILLETLEYDGRIETINYNTEEKYYALITKSV